MRRTTHLAFIIGLAASSLPAFGQVNDYRGLWAGEVQLAYVNEVTIPKDENNVDIAPDPDLPTPTADTANLRVLLHVNGAGQVSLLKDVAIVKRASGTNTLLRSENEMVLVTDERLYGAVPPQAAKRLASAGFDFGDSQATRILDALVEAVANAVTGPVANASDFDTQAGRNAATEAARLAAVSVGQPIADAADVAAAYNTFLTTYMRSVDVDAIADAADPTSAAAAAMAAAVTLQDRSVYGDSRGVDMINAVLAAVAAAGTNPSARRAAAQDTAASFAEVDDAYQRFLAGTSFSTLIDAASAAAANVASNASAALIDIRGAVDASAAVNDVRARALTIKQSAYNDTRATAAVETVIDAVVNAAFAEKGQAADVIQSAASGAGFSALSASVKRYPVSRLNPTGDYNEFVASAAFAGSVAVAAQAAAEGAVSERHNNGLWTAASLRSAALVEAVTALDSVLQDAAQTICPGVPLEGIFGPGQGDARLLWDIAQSNLAALGSAALTGVIYLPADHPTNPFRHRRHPDHSRGRDITREIRIDFDGLPSDPLRRAGYGVDEITGIYREEIHGLHKPLGPNQSVGLKMEGRFRLQRVSTIDALNAI